MGDIRARSALTSCALFAAVLLAGAALAGCASQTIGTAGGAPTSTLAPSGAPASGGGSGTSGPASSSPPLTTGGPTAKGSPIGPVSGPEETLQGTVFQGAEPSCMILRQDSKDYELLLPETMKVTTGEAVTVTGHEVHGIMSHCMQGIPFEVDTLVPKT